MSARRSIAYVPDRRSEVSTELDLIEAKRYLGVEDPTALIAFARRQLAARQRFATLLEFYRICGRIGT